MNQHPLQISVVIPTCNRKARLLSLLENLDRSTYRVQEVIIVDAGEERMLPDEYTRFHNISIQYLHSDKSVCIQRNLGIRLARSPWIFLCDDDIEMPGDYIQSVVDHIKTHPEAGAASGVWKEKEKDQWKATHPLHSSFELFWKYIFQLGIWGEIKCINNGLTGKIKRYYKRKGNHISKAGWPVNTDFAGEYVICPVYSLGASLVKREWLIAAPFDETLDSHGIGDNYGVALSFPVRGIHVVKSTFVYHHMEQLNRLKRSLQYYRRVLALHYFIRTRKTLVHVKRRWLLWSLFGNTLTFARSGSGRMIRASIKSIFKIMFGQNPYYKGFKQGKKVIEPDL